jgi:hypothetical protein
MKKILLILLLGGAFAGAGWVRTRYGRRTDSC